MAILSWILFTRNFISGAARSLLFYILLFFSVYQTLNAAQTLAQYPGSKIARENLDVFADAWESQINDLSILVKDVNDVVQGKMEKQVYLSLPRPGVST